VEFATRFVEVGLKIFNERLGCCGQNIACSQKHKLQLSFSWGRRLGENSIEDQIEN
jgi:hypothetical protein